MSKRLNPGEMPIIINNHAFDAWGVIRIYENGKVDKTISPGDEEYNLYKDAYFRDVVPGGLLENEEEEKERQREEQEEEEERQREAQESKEADREDIAYELDNVFDLYRGFVDNYEEDHATNTQANLAAICYMLEDLKDIANKNSVKNKVLYEALIERFKPNIEQDRALFNALNDYLKLYVMPEPEQ